MGAPLSPFSSLHRCATMISLVLLLSVFFFTASTPRTLLPICLMATKRATFGAKPLVITLFHNCKTQRWHKPNSALHDRHFSLQMFKERQLKVIKPRLQFDPNTRVYALSQAV